MTDLDEVRDWVGTAAPSDDDVTAALARFADQTYPAKRAALSILRRRYADMETAVDVSIVDDVAWKASRTDQAFSILRKIRALEGDLGEAPVPLDSVLVSAPICGPENLR